MRQNSRSCGARAMVPSSFMISQITPAGLRPASRQRSTEPSVWPGRTRQPPLRARIGKMCPGLREVFRTAVVRGDRQDRRGAVRRRDAGRHAFPGVNRHREAGPEGGGVVGGLRRQVELVGLLRRDGEADQPAALLEHEVDRLRRDLLGRERQVALVLALGVVHEDDHPSGAQFIEDFADRAVIAHGKSWPRES